MLSVVDGKKASLGYKAYSEVIVLKYANGTCQNALVWTFNWLRYLSFFVGKGIEAVRLRFHPEFSSASPLASFRYNSATIVRYIQKVVLDHALIVGSSGKVGVFFQAWIYWNAHRQADILKIVSKLRSERSTKALLTRNDTSSGLTQWI